MKYEEIMNRIERVIDRFLKNDSILLDYGSPYPIISERCISTRLAIYLQREFENYSVDCEYNRHIDYKKQIKNRAVFPDIVIHKRKMDGDNLVWIEVKKNYSDCNNDKRIENDRKRLRYVTNKENEYGYRMGVLIIFDSISKNVKMEVFKDGICNINIIL